jgi:hypothetical protein
MVDGKGKEAAEIEARIAVNEAKLADRRTAEIAFKTFVDETAVWVKSRDPWAQMTTADIEHLKVKLARAKNEFRDFVRYSATTRIEDLEASTLRAIITGPDRAYAALPEKVRNLVNRDPLPIAVYAPSTRVSRRAVMWRPETWRSNIAGPKSATSASRNSLLSWCSAA